MEPSLWLVSSRTRRLERRADSRALSHSFIHTIINEMSTNYVPDTASSRHCQAKATMPFSLAETGTGSSLLILLKRFKKKKEGTC